MIKINALNKFYNKNRSNEIHVLDRISLELPDSGMVAVFGRSGCGKTTLLNAIGGLDKTDSGDIFIDGERIDEHNDDLRNKRIGYIFQNYNLNMAETCFDNVADALRLCGVTDQAVIKARTLAALRNVGMENYKLRTPDTLSGGQMQRIAIARAIVKNPRIILADEPTGNLDEANTVMIMDLLKQISENHLVILVTHEANLVDHYCDRVIELSDGKVIGEKTNEGANGYSAKSKNDIYLGELEMTSLEDETLCVEKYGDGEIPKINLRIVSYQGKCYLSVDTPGISILDKTSEITLREGVYRSERTANELSGDIDMSDLPPLENENGIFGRLFGLKSSLKSGLESVFPKKKRRAQKAMRACMLLFAFVIVFISSLQGTVFRDYLEGKSRYSDSVFYVYTPNYSTGDRLLSAIGTNGIDYMRIIPYFYSQEGDWLQFSTPSFETYRMPSVPSNGTLLPYSLFKDKTLLVGSAETLSDKEIIISSATADKIIESTSLSFVTTYSDIIGFKASSMFGSYTVKGVYESNEPIAYISDKKAADSAFTNFGHSVYRASDYGYEATDGKTVLIVNTMSNIPSVGKEIYIFGGKYELTSIVDMSKYSDYPVYLENEDHGELIKETQNYYGICFEKVKAENPNMPEKELENEALSLYCKTYYDQMERYYAYAGDFIEKSVSVYGYGFYQWLYLEKDFEIAKYMAIGDYQFASAYAYKQTYGVYPEYKSDEDFYEDIYIYEKQFEEYREEYDFSINYGSNAPSFQSDYAYLLSDADYIKASQTLGTCSDGIIRYGILYGDAFKDQAENLEKPFSYSYTLIHSSDPEATEKFIQSEFGSVSTPDSENYKPIMSAETLLGDYLSYQREAIAVSLVTLAIFIGVLSLCVYLIMRSALMGRVKEIGIYRAIGVSRKNLIFRFFIETLVLTTLSVFIGYLISSFLISSWISSSSLIAEVFFYPAWMSLIILAILYGVCTVSGLIPILLLLRKTPSEILAKYDI